jgi:hypothetical protein
MSNSFRIIEGAGSQLKAGFVCQWSHDSGPLTSTPYGAARNFRHSKWQETDAEKTIPHYVRCRTDRPLCRALFFFHGPAIQSQGALF